MLKSKWLTASPVVITSVFFIEKHHRLSILQYLKTPKHLNLSVERILRCQRQMLKYILKSKNKNLGVGGGGVWGCN